MKFRIIKIIIWILLVLVAASAIVWFGFLRPEPPAISPEDRAGITLIPLPSELELGNSRFIVDENLQHRFSDLSTPTLERAMERFYSRLTGMTGIRFAQDGTPALVVHCSGTPADFPSLHDNEAYDIRIKKNSITITAKSETGILYGLESLLQLAREDKGSWVLPEMKLKDEPRYPWRGLMIDACRHWIPKEVILRNLDAMAAVKMNVLHWHLTEYQGFRVESRVFPELHRMGSNGDFYTQEDIREVIGYAADRGIRVIPEFDLPGHSTSWFAGYPELASAPGPYVPDTVFGVLDPVMDPTKEPVYRFLDRFFEEMAGLFPDQYVHIGGDEVKPLHWQNNPDIREFMESRSVEDYHALQAYFNVRLRKILEKHGKKMMGWDEIIHPDLSADGIAAQTWRDHKTLWESARQGYKAVLSAGYYLDHKQPASFHYNVDPAVIPGAVDIEIDPAQWKGWDCRMNLDELELDGSIYFFGQGEKMRGIIDFMGTSAGFPEVVRDGDTYSFTIESQFGRIRYDLVMEEDSLSGTARLSVFTLDITGHRSGGSDMEDGKPLPEFFRIEPLSPDQEANILGGEACMWTEMADAVTIESRIWPRAAAVAEKLWSPQDLTGEVDDMYRRLMIMDDRLEQIGLKHRESSGILITRMVDEPFPEPLRTLVSVLQEDRFFNRMQIYEPELYTTTPLNRVVDAARPESYVALQFSRDVDLWIESSDEEARTRMVRSLEAWAGNHEELVPASESYPRIREVEPHSVHLALLAETGLRALNNPGSPERITGEPEGVSGEPDTLFRDASRAYGGTILAIAEPVRKLVAAAGQKD
ncbi:MAG: family 20 glycosylhydrolase [Bacteroidales bacterium]